MNTNKRVRLHIIADMTINPEYYNEYEESIEYVEKETFLNDPITWISLADANTIDVLDSYLIT